MMRYEPTFDYQNGFVYNIEQVPLLDVLQYIIADPQVFIDAARDAFIFGGMSEEDAAKNAQVALDIVRPEAITLCADVLNECTDALVYRPTPSTLIH